MIVSDASILTLYGNNYVHLSVEKSLFQILKIVLFKTVFVYVCA